MADVDENKQRDIEESITQRHKKERKALQAEIQKLKHSVSKGDRKKKKEVNEKITVLEAELDAKHEKELEEGQQGDLEHKTSEVPSTVSDVCKSLQQVTTDAVEDGNTEASSNRQKKPSKAQKRRNKKTAMDQDREERIREQEIENLTSSRNIEAIKIKQILNQRGLQIHQIPSDGNCLYAAVIHQLRMQNIQCSVESLRQQVASYMRTHQDDFMPFLTKDNGDCYTQADFEEYCNQTESTPAWGGQLEIQALSVVLKQPLEVIQADGPPLITGEEHGGKPISLTYYRHAFGLGEHYNSVEAKTEDSADEFT